MNMPDKRPKIYVDRDEFMRQMLKCLGSEEYKKALECVEVDPASAQWGMAFCVNYACVHTPYMTIQDHRDTYPCNYCGSCPVWLAAFEHDTGLDTLEQVIIECVKRGCDLVGKKVEQDA